jgi:SAM-dependent methyltransferase
MDHCALSANAFHNLADGYQKKYLDLTLYDEFYGQFCESLRPGRICVLDAACGPGNVSRFLLRKRPELDLVGIDLAPRMVELARDAVPGGRFLVYDCRKLADLNRRFNGIICAFGLPYLSWPEAIDFFNAAWNALEPDGVFFLSTMLGRSEESGFQHCSSGDRVYVNYHDEAEVIRSLTACGFRIFTHHHVPSPSTAPKATMDLLLIAKKDAH